MQQQLGEYDTIFESTRDRAPETGETQDMVNHYYDLVTDFYEMGWGASFHFAPRYAGETLESSITRHQHYLAAALQLRPGMRVLDAGCGVGGPLRAIHRFSGATMVGINNNEYQVGRARKLTERAGLSKSCTFVHGSFLDIPEPDASFDRAFAIEATCHAPSRTKCFSEIFRVLQPGGELAGYEWCLTDAYDDDEPEHRQAKRGIEHGNGLPPLTRTADVIDALTAAGFEVVRTEDRASASDPETPWYLPLATTGWSLRDLPRRPLGRLATNRVLGLLESLGAVPKGAQSVSKMLNNGADQLVRGGELGIFTPMFFFHAKKPA